MSAKTIFEIDDAWLIEGGGTEHLNGRPALNAHVAASGNNQN
jgi:hypothetical protein